VSDAAIRSYTSGRFASHYSGLWSAGAVPAPGQPRSFTADDVKLLRLIRIKTAAGATHDQVGQDLPAALAAFDWQPPLPKEPRTPGRRRSPPPPVEDAPQIAADQGAQIAVLSQFVNLMGQQIADAQARADQLADQLAAARERAAAAEAKAAQLEGELLRARRPWWARWRA
jgi:hypothetical protein